MYNGVISSFLENNFKYNIRLENIPFHISEKIKNELYVFSDNGSRKTKIIIESDQEILYLKTNKANLVIEYKGIKTKISLNNVTIKKLDIDMLHELEFKSVYFL